MCLSSVLFEIVLLDIVIFLRAHYQLNILKKSAYLRTNDFAILKTEKRISVCNEDDPFTPLAPILLMTKNGKFLMVRSKCCIFTRSIQKETKFWTIKIPHASWLASVIPEICDTACS